MELLRDKMKKESIGNIWRILAAAALLSIACGSGDAVADSISVSGLPGSLIISSATAGSDLAPVTDATTTYDIDITSSTKKITGELDTAMPTHTSLNVTLAAPAGATSNGQVTLSVTAHDLVTGIAVGTSRSGLGISYEFTAGVHAGVVSAESKTVTFTISDNY
jgi:hypothetical protein